MNIYFLDDNPARIKSFRSEVPYAKIADTASYMISLLFDTIVDKTGPIDYLFLDHDLNGEEFVDSGRDDCGMEVVRFLGKSRPDIKKIIVHSCNRSAADRMFSELDHYGYDVERIPFIYFDEHIYPELDRLNDL